MITKKVRYKDSSGVYPMSLIGKYTSCPAIIESENANEPSVGQNWFAFQNSDNGRLVKDK